MIWSEGTAGQEYPAPIWLPPIPVGPIRVIACNYFGREATKDTSETRNALYCWPVVPYYPTTDANGSAAPISKDTYHMRRLSHFNWVCAMLCLAQISGLCQETLPTTRQSLEGTWIAQVAQPGGHFAPFGLGAFSPNGSYLGHIQRPDAVDPSRCMASHRRSQVRVVDDVLHARREGCVQRHRPNQNCNYLGGGFLDVHRHGRANHNGRRRPGTAGD